MDGLAGLVAVTPIVGSADAVLAHVEVLRVVDVLVRAGLDAVDDSGLEVDQDGPRYVPRVIALVVEDILAVAAFCCEVLEVAIPADSVFLAELLPELATNWALSAITTWVSKATADPRGTEHSGPGRERVGLTAVAALAGLDCNNFSGFDISRGRKGTRCWTSRMRTWALLWHFMKADVRTE